MLSWLYDSVTALSIQWENGREGMTVLPARITMTELHQSGSKLCLTWEKKSSEPWRLRGNEHLYLIHFISPLKVLSVSLWTENKTCQILFVDMGFFPNLLSLYVYHIWTLGWSDVNRLHREDFQVYPGRVNLYNNLLKVGIYAFCIW